MPENAHSPADLEDLIQSAVSELPEEIRDQVAAWMRLAGHTSVFDVQQEIVSDAQQRLERFHSAVAAVERIVSG